MSGLFKALLSTIRHQFLYALACLRTSQQAVVGLLCQGGRLIQQSQRCALVGWLVVILASRGLAQQSDSFEGGPPRWMLVESDCAAQLANQQISSLAPHAGRTSELIEISCVNGSAALLAYPLEKLLPLNEFQPRLWVRCSSGGIRLGLRVVYPSGRHPVTGGKLTTILWGDIYDASGQWQSLGIQGTERLLQGESVALRQRFGADVDLKAAYIDALVLNAYTGPGRYSLQIDSLSLNGLVPLSATGAPVHPDWRRRWKWRERLPTESERFWSADRKFSVWLYHSGESMPWLKSIGINGVVLRQFPTSQELALAANNEMDVLTPPPEQAIDFSDDEKAVIRGWMVGTALDSGSLDNVRQSAYVVGKLGGDLRRPLVAEALEEHWSFARVCDEVFVPQVARISAGDSTAKQAWLAERLEVLRPRTGGWATVSADVGSRVASQYNAAQKAVFPRASPEQLASPLVTYVQTVSSVIAGARSILLRSEQELVDGEPAQHAQIAAVRLANAQVQLWAPWTAHGQMLAAPQILRQDYQGRTWAISESRLVVAAVSTGESQFCVPETQSQPLGVRIERLPDNGRVFRITGGRMQAMNVSVEGDRLAWQVEQPAPVEAFVITSNPLVQSYLNKKSRELLPSNVADSLAIADYNLQVASRIVDARFAAGPNEQVNMRAAGNYLRRLADAQRKLANSGARMRRREYVGALDACESALGPIQAVISESYEVACENLSAPQSSPFVLTPSTLHMHWQLAAACERSTWIDVVIPGAEFRSLQGLLDGGWEQQRRTSDLTDQRVELIPADNPVQSRMVTANREGERLLAPSGGLRMASYRNPELGPEIIAGGYEGASLLVRSASVNIGGGHLVRVSATAEILKANSRWDAGVLVYDNQAGPSMGQLVNGRVGEIQKIELYRFMPADGEFRIFAECRGECDAIIRDLKMSVIKPAQNAMLYETTPASIVPELPGSGN